MAEILHVTEGDDLRIFTKDSNKVTEDCKTIIAVRRPYSTSVCHVGR